MKYNIYHIIEKYWEAECSLEEEQCLKSYFCQKDIPADLEQYREFFAYTAFHQHGPSLKADFDQKLMQKLEVKQENTDEKPKGKSNWILPSPFGLKIAATLLIFLLGFWSANYLTNPIERIAHPQDTAFIKNDTLNKKEKELLEYSKAALYQLSCKLNQGQVLINHQNK